MWMPHTPSLYHNFTVDEAGYYFLFYQVCLVDSASSSSTKDMSKYIFKEITSNFILEFNYINYDALGNISYLTAGEMPLPHIYLYFTVSYIIMLIMWLQSFKGDSSSVMSGNGDGIARKPTIYAIHHLMSSVVFLKMLTMLLESVRYHYIRVNGHAQVWVRKTKIIEEHSCCVIFHHSSNRYKQKCTLNLFLHFIFFHFHSVLCLLSNQLLQRNILIHGYSSNRKWMEFLQTIPFYKRAACYLIRNGITSY